MLNANNLTEVFNAKENTSIYSLVVYKQVAAICAHFIYMHTCCVFGFCFSQRQQTSIGLCCIHFNDAVIQQRCSLYCMTCNQRENLQNLFCRGRTCNSFLEGHHENQSQQAHTKFKGKQNNGFQVNFTLDYRKSFILQIWIEQGRIRNSRVFIAVCASPLRYLPFLNTLGTKMSERLNLDIDRSKIGQFSMDLANFNPCVVSMFVFFLLSTLADQKRFIYGQPNIFRTGIEAVLQPF